MGHPLAYLFAYDHLPEHLQAVSRPFAELANTLMYSDQATTAPETIRGALWKLWEAKNLAVVAVAQKAAR